jgi:hypothetical protein
MKVRRLCAVTLLVAVALIPVAAEAAYTLAVSAVNTRASAGALSGATLSGSRYVFLTPATGVSKVQFWLDNPNATGTPRHTESGAPWDFAGGTATTANPFDTRTVGDGTHSITAVVTLSTGSKVTVTNSFIVANNTTTSLSSGTGTYTLVVSSSNTRTSAAPLAGSALSGNRYIFLTPATGVSQVRFWLDNPGATGTPRHTESASPWDFAGGTATTANAFDTRTVANGSHTVTAAVTLSTGSTVTFTSNFNVSNGTTSTSGGTTTTTGTTVTTVGISGSNFYLNGTITYPGKIAQGKLMNVRMVNSTFEDRSGLKPEFSADANTEEFLAAMPSYVGAGVRAFTLNLQGGNPGYEGAINTAFNADGSLRSTYLARVERVIRKADSLGAVVILGLFYFRQDEHLRDEAAVKAGVVNAMKWLRSEGFRNVLVEIANEHQNSMYDHSIIQSDWGMWSLIRLAKSTAPEFKVSASSWGILSLGQETIDASDFLLVHGNAHTLSQQVSEITSLKAYGKPIVMNEDNKTTAASATVQAGASWGFYYPSLNQHYPFQFYGTSDYSAVYDSIRQLTH